MQPWLCQACYIIQNDFKLMIPLLSLPVAGIGSVPHHAWHTRKFLKLKILRLHSQRFSILMVKCRTRVVKYVDQCASQELGKCSDFRISISKYKHGTQTQNEPSPYCNTISSPTPFQFRLPSHIPEAQQVGTHQKDKWETLWRSTQQL